MRFKAAAILSAVLLSATASALPAATVSFVSGTSTEKLGSFSGTIGYSYLGNSSATLSLSLTNLTSTKLGGYLTGFAFDGPSGVGLSYLTGGKSTNSTAWTLIGDTKGDSVSTSPYDAMDWALTLNTKNASWLGGGSPNTGIAAQKSLSFTLQVTAKDEVLKSLTTESFFSTATDIPGLARFRGFSNNGSDKVVAEALPGDPPAEIPAPAGRPGPGSSASIPTPMATSGAVVLLAGLAFKRRRKYLRS